MIWLTQIKNFTWNNQKNSFSESDSVLNKATLLSALQSFGPLIISSVILFIYLFSWFYYKLQRLNQTQGKMSTQTPPVIFSTDDYLMPESAAKPQYSFFLEIIKQGSIVGKIDIKFKQFSLVGRLEDLCDIFIDNPTVSRKHAILQFQKNQPLPFLYDLGTSHGTLVNRQKLLPKAYKKLDLYANIKFGVSSRYYILRCPELEHKVAMQEQQKDNQFIKVLTQQNKALSKQELKKKYMQLLENDPYFGGQLKSRKFEGQQKANNRANVQTQRQDGISWGISDQTEVYAYKNDKQFPVQPDVIRRLPGLDETMLIKITEYEQKFRQYDEIQSELNQLANKQKRQYGLEQKLQNKKQKLERRFVQSLEALQKSEEWIRLNIFGEDNFAQNNKSKTKRQKQKDTYSDDEFYDRTLQNKKQQQTMRQSKKSNPINEHVSVQDLWQLKSSFLAELKRKRQLLLLSTQNNPISIQKTLPQQEPTKNQMIIDQEQNGQSQRQQPQQGDDQLQEFMRQNDNNLEQENKNIIARQMESVDENLAHLRKKLAKFLSQKELTKMWQQTLNPQKVVEKQIKKEKKYIQQRQKLSQTLEMLEIQENKRLEQKKRREKIDKQVMENQYSQKLFELYKEEYDEQERQIRERRNEGQDQYLENEPYGRNSGKRSAPLQNQNTQKYSNSRPSKHFHSQSRVPEQIQHTIAQKQELLEEEVVDITAKYRV